MQHAAALPVDDLVLVEKVRGAFLVAEEQPVLPLGAARLALLEEGAERRDAGAGPDHDGGQRCRRPAARSRGSSARTPARRRPAWRSRRDSRSRCRCAGAVVAVPAHRRHGEMDLARMRLGRRGDRIEPRLQAVERLQQARQRRRSPRERPSAGRADRPRQARAVPRRAPAPAASAPPRRRRRASARNSMQSSLGRAMSTLLKRTWRNGRASPSKATISSPVAPSAIEHGLHELRILAREDTDDCRPPRR